MKKLERGFGEKVEAGGKKPDLVQGPSAWSQRLCYLVLGVF